MLIASLHRSILAAALGFALPGGPAWSQAPPPCPWAGFVGYSSYRLRPSSGADQRLNGMVVGGEYRLGRTWSVEASLTHQTGTEAGDVDLRQSGFLAGARYSCAEYGRLRGFAHFLVGREQLQASAPSASDQKTSFAFGPGLGLDVTVHRHLTLRAQEDVLFTRYAGADQRSPNFFLGVVVR